jgi:hypothetical protein
LLLDCYFDSFLNSHLIACNYEIPELLLGTCEVLLIVVLIANTKTEYGSSSVDSNDSFNIFLFTFV